MEWIKLRSLRSTRWTLALTAVAAIVIGVAVGRDTKNPSEDLTSNALADVSVGLLLIGVLGVLVMTSEFTSGMIRATLAAAPNRSLVLAAKAATFGAMALALGEATSFISFFAGGATLRHGIAAPALSQPGVLQAVMRIVIAEDAALFRAGLVRLLEDDGHQVCAAVADGGALLAAVDRHQPDVVVADIRMPPSESDNRRVLAVLRYLGS